MKTPKTQTEFLQIIVEQDKLLTKLKHAVVTMENQIKAVTLLTQRVRHENRRLQEHVNTLERKLKILND